MGIWLSNGFTRAFQEAIDESPDIVLRDLYYKLARQTVGSHVMVYNAENCGNMYTNTMREFLEWLLCRGGQNNQNVKTARNVFTRDNVMVSSHWFFCMSQVHGRVHKASSDYRCPSMQKEIVSSDTQ